mmetsp:Transcript_64573/g.107302  ORF Transcript_64573/g.107302 Transcript_64573/m.107302 type:complete len:259 (-) Transcript_64573:21-797(-)
MPREGPCIEFHEVHTNGRAVLDAKYKGWIFIHRRSVDGRPTYFVGPDDVHGTVNRAKAIQIADGLIAAQAEAHESQAGQTVPIQPVIGMRVYSSIGAAVDRQLSHSTNETTQTCELSPVSNNRSVTTGGGETCELSPGTQCMLVQIDQACTVPQLPEKPAESTTVRLLEHSKEDMLLEAKMSAHIDSAQSAFFEHTHHAQRAYYEEMQKARALHYERGKARLASEQDVVAQLNAKWVEGQQKLAAVQQELAVARRGKI